MDAKLTDVLDTRALDDQLGGLESKFDRIDTKFDEIGDTLSGIKSDMIAHRSTMDKHMRSIESNMSAIDIRLARRGRDLDSILDAVRQLYPRETPFQHAALMSHSVSATDSDDQVPRRRAKTNSGDDRRKKRGPRK